MQQLTAPPREAYTGAQVTALLVAPDLIVDFGVDLLDASLTLVEDISASVTAGTVHRDNLADIHGTVELVVSRELAWGRDRVRPFMLLSSPTAGVSNCRFNLGVYLLTTPTAPLGENVVTYSVTGYDQLHLLQDDIGDSYSVPAGTNVLTAVRAVLVAAGITSPVLLDSTASAKTLNSDLIFPLTSDEAPSWIKVANALLASISYWGIWCDQDGAFRSGPYVSPDKRPVEWVFNVGDLLTGIVAAEREVVNDLWSAPNWWRFIQNGLETTPVEGAGQYTEENLTIGPSSQASLGRISHSPVEFLDAVDQASLASQGHRKVAAAMRGTEVISAQLSPFPLAWHFDTFTWSDAALGGARKATCRSWSLPLDGSNQDYILESI